MPDRSREIRRSPFVDAASVEAWDAWFRWRRHGQLCDVTIEDTWSRVARALVAAQHPSDTFEKSLLDALASWRILLDERILASAGTDFASWPGQGLTAAVNCATFVRGRFTSKATFDHEGFAAAAALAVRALDNARASAVGSAGEDCSIRVGIIGLADALAFMRVRYSDPRGRARARDIAQSLAEGCLGESVRLARDRGACRGRAAVAPAVFGLSALPATLLDDMRVHGVRFTKTTAITSQRRLALLANNVADAIDPLLGVDQNYCINAHERRIVRSSGYALTAARAAPNIPRALETQAQVPLYALIDMRVALQPWIDEPIDYPVPVCTQPDRSEQQQTSMLAEIHGLGPLRWRAAECAIA